MPIAITPQLRQTIQRVALAAESDFTAGLSVADLAEDAGMSEKHFQRCFRAVMGEPPKRYLRRIRLQAAAYYLKWSDAPVIELGMRLGFDTPAGFTKAFTKAYGRSPTSFRGASEVVPYLRTPRLSAEGFDPRMLEAHRLAVRIETLPARRVAFMRHIGPTETAASVWRPFRAWLDDAGLWSDDALLLGIHNDYWDAQSEARYRYDAAAVVPDDFPGDERVNTRVLAGGRVAMTEFAGSVAEMDEAWRRFVDQWLPVSGFRPAAGYGFDVYPPRLFGEGWVSRVLQTLTGIEATLALPVE
ncbi:MAG: AraC family transcriptional regulator [Planctomycetota bacterium]